MDPVMIDPPDNGAVITCYCNDNVAIGAMVFSDGTQHVPRRTISPSTGHYSIPLVVADPERVTSGHRFFGVAIGAPDHNHVAVAISGICTVACSHEDLDSAFLADLFHICPETVEIRGCGAGVFYRTFKIRALRSGDSVDGRRTLGVLVAHGRNPADEARFLLLPGLEHLPAPPPPPTLQPSANDFDETMCPMDDNNDQNPQAMISVLEDPDAAIGAMTLHQLSRVTFRSGEALGFRADLARFRAMVSECAAQFHTAFQAVLDESP